MAFFRSTLAGERILQSEEKRGSFELEKEGTFISWDVGKVSSLFNKSAEEVLKKVFYRPKARRHECSDLCEAVYWRGERLT